MSQQYDVKAEWEKTKKQLIKFGKEATDLAKKGEEELIKFTKHSKVHLDSTAVSLKKERMYYQIGKECVKLKDVGKPSAALKKLLEEYHSVDEEQKKLKTQLKQKTAKKKTKKAVKKTVKKKSVKKKV